MLNFDDEVLEFTIKGTKYSCKKPVNGEIKQYKSDYNSCETDEQKEETLNKFLGGLGLDIKALDLLTPTQTEKLIEGLYTATKN